MINYTLEFPQDRHGPAKEIQFKAFDASSALIFAHQEACDRSARLYSDGRLLCTIRRNDRQVWEVGQPDLRYG